MTAPASGWTRTAASSTSTGCASRPTPAGLPRPRLGRGVVTTMRPAGPALRRRHRRRPDGAALFHVGWTPTSTEGLLLLTNDGELARSSPPVLRGSQDLRRRDPRPGAPGSGRPAAGRRQKLDDGPVKGGLLQAHRLRRARPFVEVILHEGRNHIVRRMLAEVGHPVHRLVRVQVEPSGARGPGTRAHPRPGPRRTRRINPISDPPANHPEAVVLVQNARPDCHRGEKPTVTGVPPSAQSLRT